MKLAWRGIMRKRKQHRREPQSRLEHVGRSLTSQSRLCGEQLESRAMLSIQNVAVSDVRFDFNDPTPQTNGFSQENQMPLVEDNGEFHLETANIQSETSTIRFQHNGQDIVLTAFQSTATAARYYGQDSTAPYRAISIARSTDDGQSFTEYGNVPLTDEFGVPTTPPASESGDPALAYDPLSGNVYLCFLQDFGNVFSPPPTPGVRVYRSSDGGQTFQVGALVFSRAEFPNAGTFDKPAISVDPITGYVYVAAMEVHGPTSVCFAVSIDGGDSFEVYTDPNNNDAPFLYGSGDENWGASIAFGRQPDGNDGFTRTIHVSWANSETAQILMRSASLIDTELELLETHAVWELPGPGARYHVPARAQSWDRL